MSWGGDWGVYPPIFQKSVQVVLNQLFMDFAENKSVEGIEIRTVTGGRTLKSLTLLKGVVRGLYGRSYLCVNITTAVPWLSR